MTTTPADAPHRVRRLALRVQGVPTAAEALRWRSALHGSSAGDLMQTLQQTLQQALDETAAAHGLGTHTLHLPRLALTLPAGAPSDVLPRLRQGLVQALGQALAAAPTAVPSATPNSAMVPPEQHTHQLLMSYLAHGRVPWFSDTADSAQLLATLQTAAAAWLTRQAQAAGLAPWAPEDTLAGWPGWPAAQQMATITRLLRLLDAAAQARLRQQALQALDTLHTQALGNGHRPASHNSKNVHSAEPGHWPVTLAGTAQPEAALAQLVHAWWQAATTSAAPASSAATATAMPGAGWRAEGAADPATPPLRHADAAAPTAASASSSWLAHDAGLVLLHPFLPTLFQAIGCLAPGGRQLQAAALPRAAAMLGWLMHGHSEVQEFELTLGRLLLGLAPDEALPLPLPAARVDDTMQSEGQALLNAVVQHWSALGQTTPESLRTAFLARDGRLWQSDGRLATHHSHNSMGVLPAFWPEVRPEVRREVQPDSQLGLQPDGPADPQVDAHADLLTRPHQSPPGRQQPWQLRVADAPYDLLLSRLPWSLGTLRLPWMPAPLQVQWGSA